VILKYGESFAIAGLIDNRVTEVMEKLPIIGDIPIIGKLFRSRSTQKAKDELLVVITPHFVKPLTAEEKAKLPDMPASFLPDVPAKKTKKGKGQAVSPAAPDSNKPEFVGPSGQQVPVKK
jgi:pilus assembly protein CpaC